MSLLKVNTNTKKISRKCIICHKKLKFFETNLCSCNKNICMKHAQRSKHSCPEGKDPINIEKVLFQKIVKI